MEVENVEGLHTESSVR